jgi:exonuclease SbcD
MSELTGTLAELLAIEGHSEHWVRLTVTDRARPDQLFDRVKSRFPHVLQVQHVPSGARPAGEQAATRAVERSPQQLGSDFICHVTGVPADPAEIHLFEQAYLAAATSSDGS